MITSSFIEWGRGGGGEEFNSEKKLCTCKFCAFLCHCFARLQRTWNFLVARFMEEKSYMFLVRASFFFSLPLILTLLAASICHFLIAALNFSSFFFRNELRLLSFLSLFCCCCFLFCFVFRSSGPRGELLYGRSFPLIYRLPFFLSHARELR